MESLPQVVGDVGVTAATEFSILATSLLLVSLFGRLMGAVALGEYLLVRRVVTGLQSGVQMGFAVALPKHVARAVKGPEGQREAYFLVALSCLIAFAICVGLLLTAGRQAFARLLLGNTQMAHLVLPLSVWLLTLAAQVAVYGYYRGCLAMGRANAFQLCNYVLIPLVAIVFLYRTYSVALIMSAIGFAILISAGLFTGPIIFEHIGGARV